MLHCVLSLSPIKPHLNLNNELHVLLIFCFFLFFSSISHSGPHKKLSVKVDRKLKNAGKHCFRTKCEPILVVRQNLCEKDWSL